MKRSPEQIKAEFLILETKFDQSILKIRSTMNEYFYNVYMENAKHEIKQRLS